MYPKFIEVHAKHANLLEDVVTFVNVAHIMYFHDNVICTPKGYYLVSETFEELKEMIKDSGCLIHKADPRLDTDHPLTIEDLMTMVGEPVWNRNLNVWLLVKGCSDMYVDLLWTSGNTSSWDEKDLESSPLYRMRK